MDEYRDARSRRRFVSVYRSSRKDGMYLYVDRTVGMKPVPAGLLDLFGTAIPAMDLLLEPGRILARVDAAEILHQIELHGYYLQMPQAPDEEAGPITRSNHRLTTGRF